MPPSTNKKRQGSPTRSSSASTSNKKAKSSSSNEPTSSGFTSALVSEEVAFPRGGGSGLTPFEFKEVLGEGRREADEAVRNEEQQETGKSSARKLKKRRETTTAGPAAVANGKKHRKDEAKAKAEGGETDHFRVEHLNYKRLSPGTPLLGRIHAIYPMHLVLSLPSQLYAHVPLTSLSSALTARLASTAAASSSSSSSSSAASNNGEEEDEEEEEDDVPPLSELFTIGDWFPCSVVRLYNAGESSPPALEGWKPKDGAERDCRRVEASLDPKVVNEGLARVDVEAGFALTGAVKSIEDHGYVLDLGLTGADGVSFDGFLDFADVETHLLSARTPAAGTESSGSSSDRRPLLEVGQLVKTSVVEVPEHGRNCRLTVNPSAIRNACLSSISTIGSILPGALVSALITAVVPNRGLNLSLLGFFTGTVDLFHLPLATPSLEAFKVGQKVRARVLYRTTNAADQEVRFGLSLKEDVVRLAPLLSDEADEGAASATAGGRDLGSFEIGQTLETVRVVRVEGDWGLVVSIGSSSSSSSKKSGGSSSSGRSPQGFVHISHVSDTHTPTLSATSGPFAPGTSHRARVVGRSLVDGLVALSLKPSVLEQTFLKVADVAVGDVLKGVVKRLTAKALFVDIGGNVDGVAWPLHWADILLKKAERRFKVGSKVTCRVLATEPDKNRVALTLKRSLVESPLPIVADWESCLPGVVTDGVISKVLDKGCIVDLYGGLRAFVPLAEASDSFVQNLAEVANVGKPVRVKVLSVDPAQRKIGASIRQANRPEGAAEDDDDDAAGSSSKGSRAAPIVGHLDGVEVGQVVSAEVAAIHPTHILVTLKPSGAKALLSVANLANSRSIASAEEAKAAVRLGESLDGLVVVAKDEAKALAFVSFKPKGTKAAAAAAANGANATDSAGSSKKERLTLEALDYDSLPLGEVLPGRVLSASAHQGAIVLVGKSLKGRLNLTDLADDYRKATMPEVGKVVRVAVVRVDKAAHQIDLSLRLSRTDPTTSGKVVDRELGSIDELEQGQTVRGFVKNITDGGLYVTLSRDVTARVMIRNLFDEFVKDWKPRFELGQVVEGKVLEVNPMRNQVELTLKKNADVAGPAAKKLGYGDFVEGQKVAVVVKEVRDYGMFLRIADSAISGLCHKSQISDETKGDVGKALKGFRAGDQLKAVITTLDPAARKIAFSIKPSHFADEDFAASDEEEDDEDEGSDDDDDDDDLQEKILQMIGAEEESDDDDEAAGEGAEADEDEDMEDGSAADDDEDDVLMLEDDSDTEPAALTKSAAKASKPATGAGSSASALKLSGGFNWNATGSDDEASGSDDEGDDLAGATSTGPTATASKKASAAAKGIQHDYTGDLASKTPESTSDFERLLLSSPDSSFLWIQYMSFQLSMSEVAKARAVARRALKAISFREEDEKLNVWLALLNLENSYGTEAEVEQTFKEAIQFNEPKTVHLRMAAIFERTDKVAQAEDMFKRAAKKFSQSSKVWTLFGEFYLAHDQAESARALLPRALQSLPKRKHIKTIVKFAQLEYRLGDAERGRTIFEGVVESYPKRLDLWNVYIDLEAKAGDVQSVRNLFTRVLARKQSLKKAKSLFKKWMEIERRLAKPGDESGAEMVKTKAVAFVQGQSVGGGEDDEEEME